MPIHQSHEAILKRLKRAQGHLGKIIEMMETERGCLEVAQQMHAVICALDSAKKTFVHDHIDHCLEHALAKKPSTAKSELREFKEITKYL